MAVFKMILTDCGVKVTNENEAPAFDEKIVRIETWYDRHTRLWVTEKLNKDGYQIGDAIYTYGKKDAMSLTKELEAEYNIGGN